MERFPARFGSIAAIVLLSPAVAVAQEIQIEAEDPGWVVDVSIYLLGAGMDGTIGVGQFDADLDVSFSDVLENLEMGGMGSVRATRGLWSFTTDVIYMGLGGSKGPVAADVDQWMVEPSVSFHVSDRFETIVGVRYMNISAEIRGPFGRNPSGTVDWWDPFIGAKWTQPIGERWSFNLRGDYGGFDVGSDEAWQVFPFLSWQINPRASMQGGFRWMSADYDEGRDPGDFRYDVVTEGFQLGATFRF